MNIPKIIHQIWIDSSDSNYVGYPEKYESHVESLKEYNPDFEFMMWNEKDIIELLENSESIFLKEFKRIGVTIMKADFARIIILYYYGGIYIDLDFYGNRPLSEMLDKFSGQDIIMTYETSENSVNPVFNGFIASSQKNPFIYGYIHWMINMMKMNGHSTILVLETTGPKSLTLYYENYKKKDPNIYKSIIPGKYVLPYTLSGYKSVETKEVGITGFKGYYVYTLWNEGSHWPVTVIANSFIFSGLLYSIIIAFLALVLLILLKK